MQCKSCLSQVLFPFTLQLPTILVMLHHCTFVSANQTDKLNSGWLAKTTADIQDRSQQVNRVAMLSDLLCNDRSYCGGSLQEEERSSSSLESNQTLVTKTQQ